MADKPREKHIFSRSYKNALGKFQSHEFIITSLIPEVAQLLLLSEKISERRLHIATDRRQGLILQSRYHDEGSFFYRRLRSTFPILNPIIFHSLAASLTLLHSSSMTKGLNADNFVLLSTRRKSADLRILKQPILFVLLRGFFKLLLC